MKLLDNERPSAFVETKDRVYLQMEQSEPLFSSWSALLVPRTYGGDFADQRARETRKWVEIHIIYTPPDRIDNDLIKDISMSFHLAKVNKTYRSGTSNGCILSGLIDRRAQRPHIW